MQLFSDIIKLGDLPIEQKEQISDAIIYSAEHEGEFYSEVNHVKLDDNKTSMTFIRSYLPKIDKTSERYKNGLVEGVTPDPETINEAEFSVTVSENGWWYQFTNKSVNHAWSDIKSRCTKYLSNIFLSYHDEKIADAYMTTANVVTSIDLLNLKDLLKLRTILYKSNAVPFEGGFYKLKVAPEVLDTMLIKYKDIITHTTKKEAVINGELGEVGGFRLISSKLQAFEGKANGDDFEYPFVAYGKTRKGEYAVSICAYDGMAEHIQLTPLGGLGDDPLKQRGAIGLYVDGHGFYVSNDEVAVRGTYTSSGTDKVEPISEFDDALRSNLARTGSAGSGIFLNASTIGLSKNGTWTLEAKDADGKALTSATFETSNAAIATVATNEGKGTATITGLKAGACTITVKSGGKTNTAAVIVA